MYIILGKPNCPYCDKSKELLDSKNIPYIYVDITQPSMAHWLGFIKGVGLKTVPQIFELKSGGYENLRAELIMDDTLENGWSYQ